MKDLHERNILIFDDDAGMLRALDKVLTSKGAVVTCSESAEEGMKVLNERPRRVDLVITDLRMPDVSGITVISVLHDHFPTLPIMVLTAFGSPYIKAECLRQGAAVVLEKPVDTLQLLAAIERVFSSQESRVGTT